MTLSTNTTILDAASCQVFVQLLLSCGVTCPVMKLGLCKGRNGVGVPPPSPSPEDANRSNFWNALFSIIYNSWRRMKYRTQVILSVIRYRHNPPDSTYSVVINLLLKVERSQSLIWRTGSKYLLCIFVIHWNSIIPSVQPPKSSK
jgi:hypothetical protein